MSILISVVIPTRCRPETLKASLKSAVNQDFDDYEIVVSDNISGDQTEEIVKSFDSDKIRYINPGKRLSMCDNWEFALSHVRGEYVIFIGDDDAVMPGGLKKLAQFIYETDKADAYMWPIITYCWPIDNRSAWVTNIPVEVTKNLLMSWDGKIDVKNNLKNIAIRTVKHGFWRYSELPMSYHNAISTRVFREIANLSGRVFHSIAPDFITFLEIPVVADTVVRLPMPITIFGMSAKSNGGSGIAKDGEKVVQQFIDEYGQYNSHPWLPSCLHINHRFYMDPFLVPLKLFPSFYGAVKFNYSAMFAFMRRANMIDRFFVYKHLAEIKQCHRFSVVLFELYCIAHDFFSVRRKFLNKSVLVERRVVTEDNIYDFVNVLAAEFALAKG